MATTKASRKAKRESYGKGKSGNTAVKVELHRPVSRFSVQSAATTITERKNRQSKDAITKGVVKKSNAKAAAQIAKVVATRAAPNNGRHAGRQLIRWTPYTDQILLLCMEYELKRHGIEIPFKAIANRLATEKVSTGACIQQHLNKLRNQMLERGSWVPPLPGRHKGKKFEDVRGFVKCKDGDQGNGTRVIEWTEDAMMFVNPGDIDQNFRAKKVSKGKRAIDDVENSTGRRYGTRKDDVEGAADPSEPESDQDVDRYRCHKNKRVTRGSTKVASYFRAESYDSGSNGDADTEADAGSESDCPTKEVEKPAPRMMSFNDSEAEEEDRLIVVLQMDPMGLCVYPAGILGVGKDNYDGQVVFKAKHPPAFVNEENRFVSKDWRYNEDELQVDLGLEVDNGISIGHDYENVLNEQQAFAHEGNGSSVAMAQNNHPSMGLELNDMANLVSAPYQGLALDPEQNNMAGLGLNIYQEVPMHPNDMGDLNLLHNQHMIMEANSVSRFDNYSFTDLALDPIVPAQQRNLEQYNTIGEFGNNGFYFPGDYQMDFGVGPGQLNRMENFVDPNPFNAMAGSVEMTNGNSIGSATNNAFGAEDASGWMAQDRLPEPDVEQELNPLVGPAPEILDDAGDGPALFDFFDFDSIDFGDRNPTDVGADVGAIVDDQWDEQLGPQWNLEIR